MKLSRVKEAVYQISTRPLSLFVCTILMKMTICLFSFAYMRPKMSVMSVRLVDWNEA